jgi:hypothetical protein
MKHSHGFQPMAGYRVAWRPKRPTPTLPQREGLLSTLLTQFSNVLYLEIVPLTSTGVSKDNKTPLIDEEGLGWLSSCVCSPKARLGWHPRLRYTAPSGLRSYW